MTAPRLLFALALPLLGLAYVLAGIAAGAVLPMALGLAFGAMARLVPHEE